MILSNDVWKCVVKQSSLREGKLASEKQRQGATSFKQKKKKRKKIGRTANTEKGKEVPSEKRTTNKSAATSETRLTAAVVELTSLIQLRFHSNHSRLFEHRDVRAKRMKESLHFFRFIRNLLQLLSRHRQSDGRSFSCGWLRRR